jgi:glucokinase
MRIGVDIGGSKVLVALVSETGEIAARIKFPTEAERGYESVRTRIFRAVEELLSTCVAGEAAISRIGMASAGQIERHTGIILFSPNLDWRNVPLKDHTQVYFGIPVTMENDANAAVIAEWKFTLSESPGDVLGLFIGTGVGGGLVLGGRVYRGSFNVGVEAGHVIMNPHGYQCHCGSCGCLEAYCGGRYLVGRVKNEISQGYRGRIWEIINGRVENLHTGHIEEAYLLGDRLCSTVWLEAVEYLGCALAGFANLLNPAFIVLGGGVVDGTKTLVEGATAVMKRRAMAASLTGLAVVKAGLGGDAAAIGAAFAGEAEERRGSPGCF